MTVSMLRVIIELPETTSMVAPAGADTLAWTKLPDSGASAMPALPAAMRVPPV